MTGDVERAVMVDIAQSDINAVVFVVVFIDMVYGDKEHAVIPAFQHVEHIFVFDIHFDPCESVIAIVSAWSVDGGHPQLSARVTVATFHVVVGQSDAVVDAIILVKGVAIIFVETTESADPHLSEAGLHESVDLLVGDMFGEQQLLLLMVFIDIA